jgi:hypothetical protein
MERHTILEMLRDMVEMQHVMVETPQDMEMQRRHTDGPRTLDQYGEAELPQRTHKLPGMPPHMVRVVQPTGDPAEHQDQEDFNEMMISIKVSCCLKQQPKRRAAYKVKLRGAQVLRI